MAFAIAGGELIWPFPYGTTVQIVNGGYEFWYGPPTYGISGRIVAISSITGSVLISIIELIQLTSAITKIVEKDSKYV